MRCSIAPGLDPREDIPFLEEIEGDVSVISTARKKLVHRVLLVA